MCTRAPAHSRYPAPRGFFGPNVGSQLRLHSGELGRMEMLITCTNFALGGVLELHLQSAVTECHGFYINRHAPHVRPDPWETSAGAH